MYFGKESLVQFKQNVGKYPISVPAKLAVPVLWSPSYLISDVVSVQVSLGTQTEPDRLQEGLQDTVTAYEMQNKFLNKEVLELNQLRQQAIDREQKLFLESSDWEAKFYQIQSKYLLLLNELHNPQVNMQICNVYHAYAMYVYYA